MEQREKERERSRAHKFLSATKIENIRCGFGEGSYSHLWSFGYETKRKVLDGHIIWEHWH